MASGCRHRISALEQAHEVQREALGLNVKEMYRYYHWLTRTQRVSYPSARYLVWRFLFCGGAPYFPVKEQWEDVLDVRRFFDGLSSVLYGDFVAAHYGIGYDARTIHQDPDGRILHDALKQVQIQAGFRLHIQPAKEGIMLCDCMSLELSEPHAPKMGFFELHMIAVFLNNGRAEKDAAQETAQWLKSRIEEAKPEDGEELLWKFALVGLKPKADERMGINVLADTWFKEFLKFGGYSGETTNTINPDPTYIRMVESGGEDSPEPDEDIELMKKFDGELHK
ncbi:hypothetical protein C8R47DRAFT_1239826 [Mycena vitilis]|nr:hypothetical protein C8R47DRAFT_1239826 [Mycena vitilis]